MIFKAEEKFLNWAQKNLAFIALGIAIIINIIIRVSLKDFITTDFEYALNPWYEYYKANGFEGLGTGIGDYTKVYQTMICCFAKLGLDALYSYKVSSAIFDYLLAGSIAYFVYKHLTDKNIDKAILAFILVLMSPLVILNSAAWAQCDSMYVLFAIWAFMALVDEKYLWTFIFLGIGFSIKIQTVFILPFIAFYYFYKKRFSILYFAIIPAVMVLLTLPAIIEGTSPFTIFIDYAAQAGKFQKMTSNYPTFWQILNDGQTMDSLETMKTTATFFTFIVLGCLIFYWIYSKVDFTVKNMLYMAFITSYSTVLFLPLMHERYGYLYEILAIVILFTNIKTLPLCVGLILVSMQTYGCFLFDAYINLQIVAVFNVAIYIAYLLMLSRVMKNTKEK